MARHPDFGTVLGNVLLPVAMELLDMHDRDLTASDDKAPCDAEHEDALAELDIDIEVHRSPLELVSTVLTSRIVLVADYLRGIALVAVHGGQHSAVAFSTAPIARAIMEALAHIHWLAEPDVGYRERTRRVMIDTLHDLKARARIVPAARADGIDAPIAVDELEGMCRRYGVPCEPGDEDPTTGIAFPRIPGDGRPGAFGLMDQIMSKSDLGSFGPVYYNFMTDLAHASTQGILGRAHVKGLDGGGLSIGVNRVVELVHVAPIFWALPTPIGRFMDFHGWEDRRFADLIVDGAQRLTDAKKYWDP